MMQKVLRKNLFTTIAGFMLLSGSLAANADPILGQIDLSGTEVTVDYNADGDAVGLSFGLEGVSFVMPGGTGTFAAIPDFTTVSFANFLFSDETIVPLWTLSFSNDLGETFVEFSFNVDNFTVAVAGSGLIISGTGMLFATDYEATSGSFSFSTSSCADCSSFTWSSNAAATVPEPGTLALFGIGLLGLGLTSRRRRISQPGI